MRYEKILFFSSRQQKTKTSNVSKYFDHNVEKAIQTEKLVKSLNKCVLCVRFLRIFSFYIFFRLASKRDNKRNGNRVYSISLCITHAI